MGGIGIWQVVMVLAIVLILFGAGKLPKVAGDLAKGIKNFKSGLSDGAADDEAKPAGETADAAVSHSEAEPAEKDKAAQS